MAFSKAICLFLVLSSFLVLHIAQAEDVVSNSFWQKIDCGSACIARCRLASRQKMCHRACGTCCLRCNCVPPGTSGNEDVCPCYATMTTHGGRHKCP